MIILPELTTRRLANFDRMPEFQALIPKLPAGPIAEFGVYDGATTINLASFGREVYAFDTYNGIPPEDFTENLDNDRPYTFQPARPAEYLFDGVRNIHPVVGRFADTLPVFDPTIKFAFAYIDCDLYHSYMQVLGWLPARLVPGGCWLADDYRYCQGATQAIDEWVASNPGWEFNTRSHVGRRVEDAS